MKLLLSGDCTPYILNSQKYQYGPNRTLSASFLTAIRSGNEEIQDEVVLALTRNKDRLTTLRPYHDLADVGGKTAMNFAEKLFSAGFHAIEEYDDQGETPLMRACREGRTSMAAILLRKGANVFKGHRDASLLPGHFLHFLSSYTWAYTPGRSEWESFLSSREKVQLHQAAFDVSENVESTCLCSPDGFSPTTALFQLYSDEGFWVVKQSFQTMTQNMDWTRGELEKQWRCVVLRELFDRLGLTHTCVRVLRDVRQFPDDDRLEIEEEEEEMHMELETLMEEFDEWQAGYAGDIVSCVNLFFDRIDPCLKPFQGLLYVDGWLGFEDDTDCLAPDARFERTWTNSRGQRLCYGHEEGLHEERMLRILFE